MCTLALYFRVSADLPLVVAANRDELLVRPSAGPGVISHDPWVVAGQDLDAGGTWFGVDQHQMVVGVLNRRSSAGPDPSRRSRGLLCLEVLQTRSIREAEALLRGRRGVDYNGFNLLVATARHAFVASPAGLHVSITELEPGVHLLTNLDLNDPTCPRIARSHRLFRAVRLPPASDPGAVVPLLRAILSDHSMSLDPRGEAVANTLCVHRYGYGTRSSTIVVSTAAGPPRYWHAPGPPCTTPYHEVELPL